MHEFFQLPPPPCQNLHYRSKKVQDPPLVESDARNVSVLEVLEVRQARNRELWVTDRQASDNSPSSQVSGYSHEGSAQNNGNVEEKITSPLEINSDLQSNPEVGVTE